LMDHAEQASCLLTGFLRALGLFDALYRLNLLIALDVGLLAASCSAAARLRQANGAIRQTKQRDGAVYPASDNASLAEQ
jgi:hypothetical protein